MNLAPVSAVHDSDIAVAVPVFTVRTGASGSVVATDDPVVTDATESPLALTALMRKLYAVAREQAVHVQLGGVVVDDRADLRSKRCRPASQPCNRSHRWSRST